MKFSHRPLDGVGVRSGAPNRIGLNRPIHSACRRNGTSKRGLMRSMCLRSATEVPVEMNLSTNEYAKTISECEAREKCLIFRTILVAGS
jgi:hypothetical protein